MAPDVLVGAGRMTARRYVAAFGPITRGISPWVVAARWTLLGALFAAPLAFGAVQPWAWGGVAVVVSAAMVLWAVGTLRGGSAVIPWTPLYLPLAGLWALGLVQYLAHITVDPIGTREALAKGGIYLAVLFTAGAVFANTPGRAWRQFGVAVAIYTFALSLFAILQFFASPDKIYGIVVARGGYAFGPYVTHNGYAGLMEVLVPLTAAFWTSVPRGSRWRGFAAFAALLGFCSVVVSGARAGLVSLVIAMLLFAGAVITRSPRLRQPYTIGLVTGVVGVLAIASVWIVPSRVVSRFEQVTKSPVDSMGMRSWMSADTLSIARFHAAAGIGLGAFETAYPGYQSVASNFVIDYTHDDAAQLLAEGGLTAGLLVLAVVALLATELIHRVRRFELGPQQVFSLAAGFALLAIAIHSFVDFNLHLPANALWTVVCCAMATVTSPARNALQSRPWG